MNDNKSKINNKTLTIKSDLKTPTFNLTVNECDYGVIKQHNVIQTNTLNSKIDLTFSVLTKSTKMSLRMLKNETITVKWNKIKGRFEIINNEDIIISQKTYLSKFSKVFYPALGGLILLIILILLICLL